MNDKPVIHITAAEVIEKENETIYDYDNSHLIYKMQDLGSFAELQKMKVVNLLLKEKLQQKEDVINKAKEHINKNTNKTMSEEDFISMLLEILDNKGGDNNE